MGLFSELKRRNVFRVAIAYFIVAWIILQVGDVLAPALLLDQWVNRLLAFFLVLGFPVALVLAWAFELTPEGIRLEKHVDRSKSITRMTGRKLDYLIIVVLAAALGVFAFDKWVLESTRDAETGRATGEQSADSVILPYEESLARNSVVVLPFIDLSPKGDQGYFADGLTEELIVRLSRLDGLQVTGRASSFSFKNSNADPTTIGRELSVGNILSGSVRRIGDKVKVSAKLTDAGSGFHPWSKTYERSIEDTFAIQDEIADAVATALSVRLGIGESAAVFGGTTNVQAYEEYLAGKALLIVGDIQPLQAIEHLERAVKLDPAFALAWARLAEACHLASYEAAWSRVTGLAKCSDDAILKAMNLAPQSSEVLLVQAQLHVWQDRFRDAQLVLDTLPRRDEERDIQYFIVDLDLAVKTGRIYDAFTAIKSVMRHDPLNPSLSNYVAQVYFIRGRLDDALAERERAYQEGLRTMGIASVTVPIALSTGRRFEIEKWLQRAHDETSPYYLGETTIWEVLRDQLDDRDAMLATWKDVQSMTSLDAFTSVWAAWLEDDEMALEVMRRTPDTWFMWTPLLSRLRKTDEFKQIVIDLGLVDFWREFGWGDFCTPADGDDFDCQ